MPMPDALSSRNCNTSPVRGVSAAFLTASTVIGCPKLSVKSPVRPGCFGFIHGAVSGLNQRG